MELTEREKKVMTHALTGGTKKTYRNYYAASKGHDSMPELESLVAKGLMEVGGKFSENGHYYHCTEAGAKSVGLRLPKD